MTDFNFTTNGFYFRLIPNNQQAIDIYNYMATDTQINPCNIPQSAWASTKAQLKEAGYSVRKLRKSKPLSISETDKLLSELGA